MHLSYLLLDYCFRRWVVRCRLRLAIFFVSPWFLSQFFFPGASTSWLLLVLGFVRLWLQTFLLAQTPLGDASCSNLVVFVLMQVFGDVDRCRVVRNVLASHFFSATCALCVHANTTGCRVFLSDPPSVECRCSSLSLFSAACVTNRWVLRRSLDS